MKSVLKIVVALAIFVGSASTQAQTSNTPISSGAPKVGAKITKKSQLHDGCHSRYAQMLGKPCH
ncbi:MULTISPECIES: hypothetical protein [Bradyrhizobium]|uniref:Uncharacterized protein n=1 Tax=Bradyrhizobium zhanjiangense TaxID=1325107 RepID=A0A4Q0S9S7_9BRAD|nr:MULTISPECIES: hypothetical protein [Bradyrhizobium]RXG97538.1 hypothetical protein EAS62_07055 [Bradyrhizobium zhanjiangense]RXH34710.1 hypothetical protein XH94_27045 [Bradyrhizobium zhanjiangense]UQR60549.1 hypothetical protein LRP30_26530 [Bradyrhizobium sp. C-145]